MPTSLKPEDLFASAKEEILFGHGAYTIHIVDPDAAKRHNSKWTAFLLSDPLGPGFMNMLTGDQQNRVSITLSVLGIQAIHAAGYNIADLQLIGMNSASKAAFLSSFESKLKELL